MRGVFSVVSISLGHADLHTFLQERIPLGLSAAETIDLIHGQGGLAVAPHPFSYLCPLCVVWWARGGFVGKGAGSGKKSALNG